MLFYAMACLLALHYIQLLYWQIVWLQRCIRQVINSWITVGVSRRGNVESYRRGLVLQNNASKLLLAIMESRHDSENAEKILYKMRPTELVSVCQHAQTRTHAHTLDGCTECFLNSKLLLRFFTLKKKNKNKKIFQQNPPFE